MFSRWTILLSLCCCVFFQTQSARANDLWSVVTELLDKIEDRAKGFPQIYRLEFRVQTSGRKNADTDNWVKVSLNPNVHTYLDRPGDDFERGAVQTYDLMLMDNQFHNLVKSRDDIQYLEISKEGKENDWAIVYFQLLVNGQVVYEERFAERKWLGSYKVSGQTLRASPFWTDWICEIPKLRVKHEELESRLMGIVGHQFHDWSGYGWGDHGPGVRLSAVSDDTVRVHLDLRKRVRRFFDPDFDIKFNVQFVQLTDRLELRISNVAFDGDGPTGEIVDGFVKDRVQEVFRKRNRAAIKFKGVPFFVAVHPNGDLELMFGRDPKSAEREAQARAFEKQQDEENLRQPQEQQRRNQREP